MNPLHSDREARKQHAEIDAWLGIRDKLADEYLDTPRPAVNYAEYEDTVILDIGSGPRPFVEFFPAHAAFMFDCCMQGYRRKSLLSDSSLERTFCAAIMAEALPIGDERVDHVIAQNMLDHTLGPDAVVDEMYRVLRPGGFVHLAVDLGGAPNVCEPVVFAAADIDRLFQGFDLIHSQSAKASNEERAGALLRTYMKPMPSGLIGLPAAHVRPFEAWELAALKAPQGGRWARYLPYLCCPVTHGPLLPVESGFHSPLLDGTYPVENGIPLLQPEAVLKTEGDDPPRPERGRRAQGPVIANFFPRRFRPWRDTSLRLRGVNLAGSDLSVEIGADRLPVKSASRHEIVADLEPVIDRLSGMFSVVVRTSAGTSLAPGFLEMALRPPLIEKIEPESGPAGTLVTIRGRKIAVDPCYLCAYFNGIQAEIVDGAADFIRCRAPNRHADHPASATIVVSGPHGQGRRPFGFRYTDGEGL